MPKEKKKVKKTTKAVKKKVKTVKKDDIQKFIVKFPEEDRKGVKYFLVEPFAYADIEWNDEEKHYIYNLIEPKLDSEETKTFEKIVNGLLEILDIELSAIKKKGEAMLYLETQINKILAEYEIKLKKDSHKKILYYIQRNFIGLNEIDSLFRDPFIEDISCDGTNIPIFIIHSHYGSIKTNVSFDDDKKLEEFVVKLSERAGRFISYAEPLLDGTLPDGSRVQATYAKDVTTKGPTFTIRKFVEEPPSAIDLLKNNTIGTEALAFLWLAVESGSSILLAGGAGTGKTTLLNVLLSFVPQGLKIVSIEDTREINIEHENWIPAVTRRGFAKGFGEVTMFELLKESFRQTPDYVIVGEVRGKEAYVMFQGMAAGIPAMGTMHSGRVEDVIHRLQTPPIDLSPSLVDTLDLVIIMIHARDMGESARRVKEIVEIESVDRKTGTARTNIPYRWVTSGDTFEYRGTSWLMQELSVKKGKPVGEIIDEVNRRKKILEWMKKEDITKFKEVSKILSTYLRNPKKVLKMVGIN